MWFDAALAEKAAARHHWEEAIDRLQRVQARAAANSRMGINRSPECLDFLGVDRCDPRVLTYRLALWELARGRRDAAGVWLEPLSRTAPIRLYRDLIEDPELAPLLTLPVVRNLGAPGTGSLAQLKELRAMAAPSHRHAVYYVPEAQASYRSKGPNDVYLDRPGSPAEIVFYTHSNDYCVNRVDWFCRDHDRPVTLSLPAQAALAGRLVEELGLSPDPKMIGPRRATSDNGEPLVEHLLPSVGVKVRRSVTARGMGGCSGANGFDVSWDEY